MPRQDNHGNVPGDKRPNKYNGAFADAVPAGNGSWDWGQCDLASMAAAFTRVNKGGDLMSLATNRANTAGVINVLSGGTPYRKWCNTYDEADAVFHALATDF